MPTPPASAPSEPDGGGAGPPAGRRIAVVTLYARPDCHLCEQARQALERVRAEHAFELIERDIDRDGSLQRAYFDRIPVVALDGEELFDYFVDERVLGARLRELH